MRRPWFSLGPVGVDFFETAPLLLKESFEIPLEAEPVWGDLMSENPLAWCRILRGVEWTSPRPFGVGATRTARAVGGLVIHERFFRWEEGRRHSFFVEEANVPFFRRFAEDCLVEPTSGSSCRLTWTIAIELRAVAGIGAFAGRPILETAFRDTRRHYRSL